MVKTGLPTGTAGTIGEAIPSADEHILSTTVCCVLGRDTTGNKTDTALVLAKPSCGEAMRGKTENHHRTITAADERCGRCGGRRGSRGHAAGRVLQRLQPRGSPRRGRDPGTSGCPLGAQRGAWPDSEMILAAISIGWSKCLEPIVRSLSLSKETLTCFSLPVTKTQIVPAVASTKGPWLPRRGRGPPKSPEDAPHSRTGTLHAPADSRS